MNDQKPIALEPVKSIESRPELPPELHLWQYGIIWMSWIISFIALVFTVGALCFHKFDYDPCWSYFALCCIPVTTGLHLFIRRHLILHKSRLEDPSIVEALFTEVDGACPRLTDGGIDLPKPYEAKIQQLVSEKVRLAEMGELAWTEYEILPINQMLVDYLKPDDLISRSQSTLEDLEDYADQDAYGNIDRKHYGRWEERVSKAIKKIDGDRDVKEENDNNGKRRDTDADQLRAVLSTLLEHVANYQKNWAEGNSIYRGLSIFCLVTIPTLFVMGLLPVAYYGYGEFEARLYYFHWAALGIAGSLTAVLRGIHRSDVVEIGNTQGKRELWRAIHGSVLGLVGGILTYASVAGGLINNGSIIPDLAKSDMPNIGLSVLLAFGSGFFFERVFERLRPSSQNVEQ
jgi:hypothetical protein